MSECVDTNIFVRLLTRDDPEKAADCLWLFLRAERGEEVLYTSEAVVAEMVFVLSSSSYRTPRGELVARLRTVLVSAGLRLDHKETVLAALALYERTNLHFVDCHCVDHARRPASGIYSYDREIDRVTDVPRWEP